MVIEVTAKKVQDAIKEGLQKLDAKLDDVDVEILSQGGLFKKAKVRITLIGSEDAATEKPAEKPAPKAKETPAPEKPSAPAKPAQKTEKQPKADKPKTADRPPRAEKERRDNRAAKAAKREENAADITPEITAAAEKFLRETVEHMGVTAEIKTQAESKQLTMELVTEDSAVIGYRGEALDALEYLTSLVAGRGEERFVRVRLDCNGYRAKREESLIALAARMADKCARTGKKVTLEPMSSAHRRVIHAALTDDDRVITRSEGREPSRRVAIIPKKKQ